MHTAEGLKQNPASTKSSQPLHGVPVVVKEWLAVKGTYATAGMACRLVEGRSNEDCLIIRILRGAGAIPLAKGNVIQMLMLAETNNRIYGRTLNPWDLCRTPGGSSGGDAALVAMGCVSLSISTDGAGSIRIPACYCGIVGFKPTTRRTSLEGCMKPRKDNRHGLSIVLSTTVGPMARCVEDCTLFMRAICVPELWKEDNGVPPVPFDENAYKSKRKLSIGYFETDDWFEPCDASKRALNESLDALRSAGHTIVLFKPPTNGWDNFGLLIKLNASEGSLARTFGEALEGETVIPEYRMLILGDWLARLLPAWLLGFFLKLLLGPRMHHLFQASRKHI